MTRISVIIPAFNEEEGIRRCIEAVRAEGRDIEIIVADGGSRDRTAELASRQSGVKVVESEKGRGIQMNAGAAAAGGDILLFLHADTQLETGWSTGMLSALKDTSVPGGAFAFSIPSSSWKYRLVEAWVKLRCRFCSLPYGDQAIFLRRSAFDLLGGYKKIPLMEDVDLVSRLKKLGPVVILNKKAVTSERRWIKNGLIRTAAMNQFVMLLYKLGVDPRRLARIYYR